MDIYNTDQLFVERRHWGSSWYNFYNDNGVLIMQMWNYYKEKLEVLHDAFIDSLEPQDLELYNRVKETLRKYEEFDKTFETTKLTDIVSLSREEITNLLRIFKYENATVYSLLKIGF
jgi:hypothetical protein